MSSCAVNRAVIKPDYDFSEVKTIRVGKFSSSKIYGQIGDTVGNAFIQCLLAKGYNVISDSNVSVDAVIEGSITAFHREREDVVWPIDVYRRRCEYVFGEFDQRRRMNIIVDDNVVIRNAIIGISAYMTDVKTGQVVWSDSFTYESVNIDYAITGAIKYILKTLPRDNTTLNRSGYRKEML
jgi:hypothetical protein